jgi:hypothetical protein
MACLVMHGTDFPVGVADSDIMKGAVLVNLSCFSICFTTINTGYHPNRNLGIQMLPSMERRNLFLGFKYHIDFRLY